MTLRILALARQVRTRGIGALGWVRGEAGPQGGYPQAAHRGPHQGIELLAERHRAPAVYPVIR